MNVECRCESLNIDYKEHYRVGADLPVFLIIILYYLIIYTFKVISGNNRKLSFGWLNPISIDPKDKIFQCNLKGVLWV